MKRLKVAVLCGGPSSEWEVSIRSGEQVVKNLPLEKYDAKLVQITPDGRWLLLDRKRAIPLKLFGEDGRIAKSDLKKFDLAFNALHGAFGEDGHVQAILDLIGIPYTGSGIMASSLGMNKLRTNEIMEAAGLNVPKTVILGKNDLQHFTLAERRLKRDFSYPFVIKPNSSGSSVGVTIVRSPKEFVPALSEALNEGPVAMAQEYIAGRETTCAVVGNYGGETLALPPVEIISKAEFFDYESKYTSKETQEICPIGMPPAIVKKLQELAVKAHFALGADGLTRSDFICVKGKFYFLEINTSPGMTEASLCPKEARAYGLSFGEFLDWLCELGLSKAK